MRSRYFYFLLVLLSLAACRSSKNNATTVEGEIPKLSPKQLQAEMQDREFDYDWLSCKIKMDYFDGNKSQGFTANLRMKKDSIVWLSLTGPFGIEGARILIKEDSIQIVDKLSKKYYHQPLDYLLNYAPFALSLSDLQKLFTGDELDVLNTKPKVEIKNKQYHSYREDVFFESTTKVYPQSYTLDEWSLKDKEGSRQIQLNFDGYESVEGQSFKRPFAYDRTLWLTDGTLVNSLKMEFGKLKFEGPLKTPFSVNPNYEKVE